MSAQSVNGDRTDGDTRSVAIQLQELGRRNQRALAMDALYLFTTSFFAVLATKAWDTWTVAGISIPYSWAALIAAVPLAGLFYFGWRSSLAFLAAQLATIAVTIVVAWAGLLPL